MQIRISVANMLYYSEYALLSGDPGDPDCLSILVQRTEQIRVILTNTSYYLGAGVLSVSSLYSLLSTLTLSKISLCYQSLQKEKEKKTLK